MPQNCALCKAVLALVLSRPGFELGYMVLVISKCLANGIHIGVEHNFEFSNLCLETIELLVNAIKTSIDAIKPFGNFGAILHKSSLNKLL